MDLTESQRDTSKTSAPVKEKVDEYNEAEETEYSASLGFWQRKKQRSDWIWSKWGGLSVRKCEAKFHVKRGSGAKTKSLTDRSAKAAAQEVSLTQNRKIYFIEKWKQCSLMV